MPWSYNPSNKTYVDSATGAVSRTRPAGYVDPKPASVAAPVAPPKPQSGVNYPQAAQNSANAQAQLDQQRLNDLSTREFNGNIGADEKKELDKLRADVANRAAVSSKLGADKKAAEEAQAAAVKADYEKNKAAGENAKTQAGQWTMGDIYKGTYAPGQGGSNITAGGFPSLAQYLGVNQGSAGGTPEQYLDANGNLQTRTVGAAGPNLSVDQTTGDVADKSGKYSLQNGQVTVNPGSAPGVTGGESLLDRQLASHVAGGGAELGQQLFPQVNTLLRKSTTAPMGNAKPNVAGALSKFQQGDLAKSLAKQKNLVANRIRRI